MKVKHNYKQPVICAMILALLAAASCKKSFYSDVNVNPNAPSAASIVPAVLLPPIESAMGYLQGGDLSRFASLNIQQVKGVYNQADGFYRYVYLSQDFDNVWGNIYTAVLENDDILLQMSETKGYHAYAGVARILRAYALQVAVDLWGPIPYTKALQGAGNLKPQYDNDKLLYDTIGKLLDDGIANLNNTNAGALVPGDEDALYGGDSDKWIKFAHAIKARLFIHQSKGDANMAAKALTEIAASFSANGDNARYVFGSTETTANPWYQFNQQRSGYIGFSSGKVGKMMKDLNDPRLPILIDTSKKDALLYYGVTDAPVEFITYDELLFASAEAVLRNGGTIVAAQAFYRSAITANMSKLGVKDADITTYLATNGTLPGNVDAAIAQVSTQEYLALYLNPEAWTLWRRTNIPALTPVSGTSVPRRLLYPQTEYSYNKANVPASVTLFSPKIFWDK